MTSCGGLRMCRFRRYHLKGEKLLAPFRRNNPDVGVQQMQLEKLYSFSTQAHFQLHRVCFGKATRSHCISQPDSEMCWLGDRSITTVCALQCAHHHRLWATNRCGSCGVCFCSGCPGSSSKRQADDGVTLHRGVSQQQGRVTTVLTSVILTSNQHSKQLLSTQLQHIPLCSALQQP